MSNSNISPTCPHNMVNFGPTSGWDLLASLGHPSKFEQVSRVGSVTARHCSSGRQPNLASLNRGRHLYSAGRPSRWSLAHISSHLSFNGLIAGDPVLSGSPSLSSSICPRRQSLGISGTGFTGHVTFLSPSQLYKTMMETQSTDPNQWPGLIISSSTTGLLKEEVLLPLRWFSNASTSTIISITHIQPFYGSFSGTTRVRQYQKKSSPGLLWSTEDNRGWHTDRPVGLHSIQTNQQPTSIIPHFDAGCPSCHNPPTIRILVWDRHQICWLAYPETQWRGLPVPS